MQFYRANFIFLALVNSILGYREYSHILVTPKQKPRSPAEGFERETETRRLKRFKWNFISIYLAVNGADWLQGPYIYPLYKDEKGLSEEMVARLFMTGFISAAITASFAGKLADTYGRKQACLAFCLLYSLSCLILLSDNIWILFVGRVLGGMSTTLMYSVFESWMVTEFNKSFPGEPGFTLIGIFSMMTTLNAVVAITAGIVAEWATDLVGTEKAPFMLAVVVLLASFGAISHFWGENYGERLSEKLSVLGDDIAMTVDPPQRPLRLLVQDKQLRALGITSCFFEGSMYIFIFFKFPALKLSHKLSGIKEDLPFGLIFAILMSAMMLGSLLYNYTLKHYPQLPPTKLLITVLFTASASLFIPVLCRDERITFWCFCLFEVCCGVYFPLMAYQKGKLIADSMRANIYGLMRIPLNVFVVLVLSTTRDGFQHRDMVFTTCSALMLFAVVMNA